MKKGIDLSFLNKQKLYFIPTFKNVIQKSISNGLVNINEFEIL